MNPFESVLMSWKNLQLIIWSEVSQKNKYRIFLIYMESRKTVLTNLFTRQQWRYRHREQTYGHRLEGGGRPGDEWRD